MFSLQMRMTLLLTALFGIVYAIVVLIGTRLGIGNFYFYLAISFGMMFLQYLIGPKMVEWSMQIRYVRREEYPQLFSMVENMAIQARLPMPRIGISALPIPNAFAFGRGLRDGRVCVTQGILDLLNPEELRAVLGHELTHIRNRDVLTITILSVIPMILYRIAWQFMFYGGNRREREGGNTFLIGLAAFVFYFITNLLILYASRIREYYADRGSLELGNKPSSLATALYKLVYGSARIDKSMVREAEGLKAFFINDPSRALMEIRELSQLDLDRSGTIDTLELAALRNKTIRLNFADKAMELLSTHPNMLKRIKALSQHI
ncbi:MAG: M48 family metalloprotease [Candidatus Omnitrophica bacterium]|nr:M48 family metalloprotease [Candidatus Omnitrophota bacterium]